MSKMKKPGKGMREYVYIGKHPEVLDGGRPIAFGERFFLERADAERGHNADLISLGMLKVVPQRIKEVTQKKDHSDSNSEGKEKG